MLLHEAIDIPTEVRTGDLVFKLTDAHEHTDETLANYVVADQLRVAGEYATNLKFADCLPEAMALEVARQRLIDPPGVARVLKELG